MENKIFNQMEIHQIFFIYILASVCLMWEHAEKWKSIKLYGMMMQGENYYRE